MAPALPPPCSASNKDSFAYESVAKRWPVILTDIINRIVESLEDFDEEQGKALINDVQHLKYNIGHNKALEPLEQDGEEGVSIYNSQLEALTADGRGIWYKAPWLYSECYMYRHIRSLILRRRAWTSFDPFEKSKTDSFKSSGRAVFTLVKSLQDLVNGNVDHTSDDKLRHATFLELIKADLWGNASGDLSLFAGLSASDIDALQNGDSSDRSHRIIHNDLDKVWEHLSSLQNARIDVVLDNAGFELFTDLLVADWLVSCTTYCSRVVFHPKLIPWFVSDVMPKDFDAILDQLKSDFFSSHSPSSEEASALEKTVQRWRKHLKEEKFSLSTSSFWTSPSAFSAMPLEAPELLAELQKSGLVIFKGDLNYRKLTGDLEWPHDTPFKTALGELQGKIDLVALRTCKADVVVGLEKGKAEQLQKEDARWRWNGKWGIVAFSGRDRSP